MIGHKNLLSKSKKSECFKWTYGLSGNEYRVDTLPKSYLIVIRITMQSFKSIGQFWPVSINENSWLSRTDGPTLIIEKLRFKKKFDICKFHKQIIILQRFFFIEKANMINKYLNFKTEVSTIGSIDTLVKALIVYLGMLEC